MASRPPPASFSDIAVDDMLAVPVIQELIATDAALQDGTLNDNNTAEDMGNPPPRTVMPEEIDIEAEDMRPQETTRSIPACIEAATKARQPSENAQLQEKTTSDTSDVLSTTGQRIHVMNAAELEDLCRKLQVQTASISHDKLEKAEARRQQTRIHELRAELSRLRGLETQLKQYQQRPMASLASELNTRQQEIADLSTKLQAATQEELDWVDFMSPNLR